MRDFIKDGLVNIRNKGVKTFSYQYKRDDGDIIVMCGNAKNGNADFSISRIKSNGHKCSNIPVYQMPLTDKYIGEIAEFAAENL